MKLGNKATSYISPGELSDIYTRLSEAFPGAVIIGGRAVNLHCGRETRGTHDIDVVVGQIRAVGAARETLQRNGFAIIEGGSSTIKKLVDIKRGNSGVEIDIYTKEAVGGVDIRAIMGTAAPVSLGAGSEVLVANSALLVLMKHSAGRGQDLIDIRAIVTSSGGVEAFLSNNADIIASQFPDIGDKTAFEHAIRRMIYGEPRKDTYTPNPRTDHREHGRWAKARRDMRRRKEEPYGLPELMQ